MTQAEIFNIEIGDKLYLNQKIHKRIFNSPWFLVYKPDKFYTIFKIDKTETYIRLTTASELGFNKVVVYKVQGQGVKVPVSIPILQHFNLLKKVDYQAISNIDYFAEL